MSSSNSRYSVISSFKKYDEIKIPIIQRDYAQGRESAKEIRKNFLNSIKNSLNKQLHLDFIYGSVKEHNGRKALILLDGQQRITTLFLLYWYAAIREGKINEFQKNFCFRKESIIKSKLRYEVRASSEEFLDHIVSDTNIRFENEIKPSEIIKDKNWFYLGWLHDPTISGMLNMIDDIHETFKGERKLFKLLYDDPTKITFDFLELNNFGLTDDLYIKMNSRGKLLTPYENFKAKFEKLIKKDYSNEEFIKIAHKFDKDYLDIFWKYAKRSKKTQEQDIARLTDGYMYWFFYNLTLNLYAINNETTDSLNNYSKIDDFIQENSLVSFFEEVYKSKKEIDNLIEFLDYLCSNDQDIPEQVKNILRENPTLWDRVRFYAYYLEIIEHKDDEHWYRVLKNLINNTRIESLEDYIKALKAIKKLSDDLNGQKILDHIRTKEKFIDFFSQNQQTEEMLKAKLINEDSSWEREIIKAENHWYLDGKIGFLIEFSKSGNDYDLGMFKNYRDKFIKLWDFVKETKENQILLYQALLSKGDYLPEVGWNKTFCSFETGIRAKSENWHRVFESDKKEYLKSLLDDINLTRNIENELNRIIKTEVTGVSDWRKYFIENPNYIKYCEKSQLRFDKGRIYLLKRRQMNGRHAELHSWHFFNKCFGLKPESDREVWWKLEGKKACDPFDYTEYVESTSYEEPCVVLGGFKYKIEGKEYDLELKMEYENGKNGEFQYIFIDSNDEDVSNLDIRINNYEIKRKGTFSMPQEIENCCEWLIRQISKKSVK